MNSFTVTVKITHVNRSMVCEIIRKYRQMV